MSTHDIRLLPSIQRVIACDRTHQRRRLEFQTRVRILPEGTGGRASKCRKKQALIAHVQSQAGDHTERLLRFNVERHASSSRESSSASRSSVRSTLAMIRSFAVFASMSDSTACTTSACFEVWRASASFCSLASSSGGIRTVISHTKDDTTLVSAAAVSTAAKVRQVLEDLDDERVRRHRTFGGEAAQSRALNSAGSAIPDAARPHRVALIAQESADHRHDDRAQHIEDGHGAQHPRVGIAAEMSPSVTIRAMIIPASTAINATVIHRLVRTTGRRRSPRSSSRFACARLPASTDAMPNVFHHRRAGIDEVPDEEQADDQPGEGGEDADVSGQFESPTGHRQIGQRQHAERPDDERRHHDPALHVTETRRRAVSRYRSVP